MSTFEIYLLRRDDAGAFDAASVLEAMLADGRVQPFHADPARALYRNLDTGVFFQLTLAPPVAALWSSRLSRAEVEDSEGEEPDAGDRGAEEPPREEEGEEDLDEEGEGEEDEEAPFDIEMTPIVLSVPLLCPAFFGREAAAFAERIVRAADLHLDHPEPREGSGGEPPAAHALSPEEILSSWDRSRRELARALLEQRQGKLDIAYQAGAAQHRRVEAESVNLTYWSPEKAEGWWRYGAARARLQEDLAADGVRVPPLQAAYHEGRVKTLCDFETGAPAVIPRTDLVLLRRERIRKGFLLSRRVREEGLLPGERLWEILESASEFRSVPVDLLVFRKAADPPQRVAAKLEELELAPLAGARRTSLMGVIDFDPEAPAAAG